MEGGTFLRPNGGVFLLLHLLKCFVLFVNAGASVDTVPPSSQGPLGDLPFKAGGIWLKESCTCSGGSLEPLFLL